MTAGMVIGYLLSNKKKLITISNKLVTLAIYLLLLFLGISVGLNDTIISEFKIIGFQAVIITFGATFGSVILAYFVYRFFYMGNNKKLDNDSSTNKI